MMFKHLVSTIVTAVAFAVLLGVAWISIVSSGLLERIIGPQLRASTDLVREAALSGNAFRFLYAMGTSGIIGLTVLVLAGACIVLAYEVADMAGGLVTKEPASTERKD